MNATPVIVEPLAKRDIREARDWYEAKGENLSSQFRDDLSATFNRIASTPLGTAIAFGRTRLKPMGRFPYIVSYIFHDGTVHITAAEGCATIPNREKTQATVRRTTHVLSAENLP